MLADHEKIRKGFSAPPAIAEASGYGPLGYFIGKNKVYIWEPAWAHQPGWGRKVDAAIDTMLRDKNGLYRLDPASKIGAFKHNTKGNQ